MEDLQKCGIQVNLKDTQRNQTQTIKFLGFLLEGQDQMIGHTGTHQRDLTMLLSKLDQKLPLKTVERFVSHLVFYFSLYRAHYHMLGPLFRLLNHPEPLPAGYLTTLRRVWDGIPHRVP